MRRLVCPGGDLESAGCLDRVALAAGMAVVFPNGSNAPVARLLLSRGGIRTWNAGGGRDGATCVSGDACKRDVDDVGYVRALLADVGRRIAVDPKRVFATGFSNGAALAHRLACEAADLFAAVAPVSGENQAALAACAPSRPVAVLSIHGTLDRCWPYAGGAGACIATGRYVSVEETLAGWAARNGCRARGAADDAAAASGHRRRHAGRAPLLYRLRRRGRAAASRGRRQRPLLARWPSLFPPGPARRHDESSARHGQGHRRFPDRARTPLGPVGASPPLPAVPEPDPC